MLLPDNIHPEYSIYYNGSLIIKELRENNNRPIFDLYEGVKLNYHISYPMYILCLDWLYLIDMVIVDERGVVRLCS